MIPDDKNNIHGFKTGKKRCGCDDEQQDLDLVMNLFSKT